MKMLIRSAVPSVIVIILCLSLVLIVSLWAPWKNDEISAQTVFKPCEKPLEWYASEAEKLLNRSYSSRDFSLLYWVCKDLKQQTKKN